MRQAVIVVSFEDIISWLRLPKGHSISAVVPQTLTDAANKRVMFLIDGPQLPEMHDGAAPMVMDMIRDGYGRTRFGGY